MKTKVVRTNTSGNGFAAGQRKLAKMQRKGWIYLANKSASLGRDWLQDNFMVLLKPGETLPPVPGGWTPVGPQAPTAP